MFDIQELGYILRIILAGICGMVIGLERKNRSKEAGIRTHFVVACGAALMMIVSKYAFFDIITKGIYGGVEVRLDPSRIASTIASGIGFLGAGMIFVQKNTIIGLTTAAGIWATSGVGMAIGAGMYSVGIVSTIIILIAQIVLHIDFHRGKNERKRKLIIQEVNQDNYQKYINQEFEKRSIQVKSVSVEKTNDTSRNYVFLLELPEDVNEDDIITMVGYKSIIQNHM